MGAKQCELCDRAAMMYCESDQASLCWECDAKVHSANFIVARHARRLLCRRCQLPTPWQAEGAKLVPAVSVCERCCGVRVDIRVATEAERRSRPQGDGFGEGAVREDDEGVEDEDEDEEEDEEEEDDEEEEEEEEEDEDGENQVVPWTSMPPPPVASSSSSEDEGSVQIGRNGGRLLKRSLDCADLSHSQENLALSSPGRSPLVSAPSASEDEGTSLAGAFQPWANGVCKRPALIRSATPAQSAAAPVIDVRVHGERVAIGLVSSRSCLPPM